MSYTRFLWVLVLASGLANAVPVPIDGTFTYQAQIKQNGSPANGTFDFQFRLFDDGVVGQGASVGATLNLNDVVLVNGQLSTNLKFGNSDLIGSNQLFLEIGIRDGASNQPYTLLNPRQRLTEVPFASYADHADFALKTGTNSVDSLSIVDSSIAGIDILDGTITGNDIADGAIKSADIDSTQVQRRVSQVCAPGSAIRTVAQDGTVICEAVGGGGGGGVTSITAGTGLTGGTITTTGTIAIAAGGVGSTQINTTQVQRRSTAMLTACAGTNQSIKTIAEDGTVTCETDDSGTGGGSGWALTGNALTGTEFLGSNNGFPVLIKANNARAAQYEKVSGSVNGTVSGTGINVLQGDPANSIATGVLGGTVSGGGRQVNANPANPNSVTGNYGTVAGGYSNTAGGTPTGAIGATVSGGHANNASAHDATVGGGAQNTASARQATVGGGNFNVASGINALIPGGRANTASGDNSVVLGNCGTSTAAGAVLIAAVTTPSDCINGIVNASSTPGTVSVIAGSGGVVLAPGSGGWTNLSDRNMKHAVTPVDAGSILDGVLAMPIATWTYNTQDDGIRHMGPMAQDFYSTFSLGETDRGINGVDADGVALAAIQGLHEKMERENAELKQRNAELESKNAEMEQRLNRLEQTLLGTERNAGR